MSEYLLKDRVKYSDGTSTLEIYELPNLDAAKLFVDQCFLGQKQNEKQGAVILAEEIFPFRNLRRKYTSTLDGWYKVYIKNKEDYLSHDIYKKSWKIIEKNGLEYVHIWTISEKNRNIL